MTYLAFHAVFILPPIALLLLLAWRAPGPRAGWLDPSGARTVPALALILVLALVYTTPWDNHLVARGVWTYPPDRVLFTIRHVPVEEYAFFLLQPIMTGLFLLLLARHMPRPSAASAEAREAGRWIGTAAFLLLTVLGAGLLGTERGTYLGLVLVWASPVAALQWGVGGPSLVAHGRIAAVAVAVPTLYLWLADRAALALGIWAISSRFTTGLHLFGLPIEEAIFFLMTNLIVVQGLVLFLVLGRRAEGAWTA